MAHARAQVEAQPDLVSQIGLIGETPRVPYQAARGAFERGELDSAIASASAAAAIITGAAAVGQKRLLIALGGVVLLLVLLLLLAIAIRRRRRRVLVVPPHPTLHSPPIRPRRRRPRARARRNSREAMLAVTHRSIADVASA